MTTKTISVDNKKIFGDLKGVTVNLVSGGDKRIDVLYSIAYMRTFREDTGLARIVGRIAKFFAPSSLIVPWHLLKEDTQCILTMEILSIQGNKARLKYDISICNGGKIHKAIVRKAELKFFKNGLRLPVWFSFSNQCITLDLRKCYFFSKNRIESVKDMVFAKGGKCLIRYV